MFKNSPNSQDLTRASGPGALGAMAEVRPGDSSSGGKVVHDSRGNAVWDWAVATGVLAGTKAAELLRMLDDPTLMIEGELAVEWAGDPYNRR